MTERCELNEHCYCYCAKCSWSREDDIMEEKAKVYNPLPDNVIPKSYLSILEDEETRKFMGMNEVEFETFMNQLLHESRGDED
mgnify:CR=1 FL=1